MCEQKKAPLKLVPIISEVFSKLSCDLVGPLPKSNKGNKYLLTAVCTYSRYPETIPILNMLSETVTEAIVLVFSRLGYPLSLKRIWERVSRQI